MKRIKFTVYLFGVAFLFGNLIHGNAQAILGKPVSSVQLIDPNDHPKSIPFLGEKVVMIFYTDPDVKDVNDELSNAIKAKNYPKNKYQGIGIANCKDTWIPNAGIRMKARQKEQQFPGSVILLDEKLLLAKTWSLGDCNDAGIVIIIGKDSKVKMVKTVKKAEESKLLIPSIIKLLEEEMAK